MTSQNWRHSEVVFQSEDVTTLMWQKNNVIMTSGAHWVGLQCIWLIPCTDIEPYTTVTTQPGESKEK